MDLEGSDTIHQEQQTKEVPLSFSGVWREVERVGVKTMPGEFHESPASTGYEPNAG